jgi:hypothetical protein
VGHYILCIDNAKGIRNHSVECCGIIKVSYARLAKGVDQRVRDDIPFRQIQSYQRSQRTTQGMTSDPYLGTRVVFQQCNHSRFYVFEQRSGTSRKVLVDHSMPFPTHAVCIDGLVYQLKE